MRKIPMKAYGLVAALGLALAGGWVRAHDEGSKDKRRAQAAIEEWPDAAQRAARAMIDKYGEPEVVSEELLLWRNTGDFKRTVVFREEVDHDFPMPHKDVLLQTVSYRVPAEKADELTRFDGSLYVDRTAGELSAKCDREEANILTLNLAHDIIEDRRGVDEARRFLAETLVSAMAGRESDYVEGLKFETMGDAADRDEALLEQMLPEQIEMQEGGLQKPGREGREY